MVKTNFSNHTTDAVLTEHQYRVEALQKKIDTLQKRIEYLETELKFYV